MKELYSATYLLRFLIAVIASNMKPDTIGADNWTCSDLMNGLSAILTKLICLFELRGNQ